MGAHIEPQKHTPAAESVAARHPKRGKAHRTYGESSNTICGFVLKEYGRVMLSTTAPEDRCRICWPPARPTVMPMKPDGLAEEDYLPPAALDRIGEHIARMPKEFDLASQQAHTKSITVTFRFPGITGPFGQVAALDALLQGAMLIEALYLNLRAERAPTDGSREES